MSHSCLLQISLSAQPWHNTLKHEHMLVVSTTPWGSGIMFQIEKCLVSRLMSGSVASEELPPVSCTHALLQCESTIPVGSYPSRFKISVPFTHHSSRCKQPWTATSCRKSAWMTISNGCAKGRVAPASLLAVTKYIMSSSALRS